MGRTNDQAMRTQKSLRCLPVRVQVLAQDEHGPARKQSADARARVKEAGSHKATSPCAYVPMCLLACVSSHTCALFLLSEVLIHARVPRIHKIHELEDEEILGLVEGSQMLVEPDRLFPLGAGAFVCARA